MLSWAVLRAILLVTMASWAQRQVALLAVTKRTNGHEARTIKLLEAGRASSGTLSSNGVRWRPSGGLVAGTPDGNPKLSSLEERLIGDSLTHTLGAYLALEGSGVLPAGQSAPGEIDEVVGDLGRSSRKQDGQFVRTTSAACRRRWLR